MLSKRLTRLIFLTGLTTLLACQQPYSISVNNQPIYDPGGRLRQNVVVDADLQGCINVALRQQNLTNAALLTVLSCANSEINDLENIGQLRSLRFLDLSNNNITNITPLESLLQLGGLNLVNNQISDIGPLFNIPTLSSVTLLGNNTIPCNQLRELAAKLGNNLTPPASCNP